MTKQFGPLVKARNVPEPCHNEYRVTSRHAQTACAVVFLKTVSGKVTRVKVSRQMRWFLYFFFFLSNKKGLCGGSERDAAGPEKHLYFFFGLNIDRYGNIQWHAPLHKQWTCIKTAAFIL